MNRQLEAQAKEDLRLADKAMALRLGYPYYARCCGAPIEPVASTKWYLLHRRGLCFGGTTACERALRSANLHKRLIDQGADSVRTLIEKPGRMRQLRGQDTDYSYTAEDGDGRCCGAPDGYPVATSKYALAHYNGWCFGSVEPCGRARKCQNLAYTLRKTESR